MSLRKINRDEWPDGFTGEQIAAMPANQAARILGMRSIYLSEAIERQMTISLWMSSIAACIALANAWFQLFT